MLVKVVGLDDYSHISKVAIFRNSFCRREGLEESVLNVGVTNVAAS